MYNEGVAAWFNGIVNYGVGIIWGNNDWLIASNPWYGLLVFVLIGAGLYFTVVTRFIQFRHFGHMWNLLRVSNQGRKDGGISSFEALMTSLAARVGTGNLAGVAIAVYLGGPGAVFWMWMTAIVGMSTSFIESTLAQAYKVPHTDNVYRGGPAYYIEKGLGKRWLAVFFSLCLLVAFGLAFNGVQSNTIAQATNQAFGVPTWVTGVVLVALVAPVVFGGLRSVARIAGKIVPIMAILYILLALFIVITNFSQFPGAIVLIVKSAFGFEQAAGGVIGYGIAQAMLNGIKRGLFSNEAGMGSAPNAAATAKSYPDHPAVQGFMQMLGVFMDTLIICTATASIIILSGVIDPNVEQEGIQLTQLALSQYVGDLGIVFVAIAIFFFSFTSIIANYSYGESNLEFISGSKNAKMMIMVFRFMVLGMVFIGAVASLPAIWNFADLSMGLMALVNLTAILILSPVALRILRDYERQIKEGKTGAQIKFDPDKFVKLKDEANRDAWSD